MTDTLTQRVAKAIQRSLVKSNDINDAAQAAIEASGAQHLQGLVKALEFYARAGIYKAPLHNNESYFDCGEKARKALAALPEEARGGR
jgi:hypothetical protein